MRALTDDEIKSLAPRVRSIMTAVWSNLRSLLMRPEYKALAEIFDIEKFEIFLQTETGTVISNFKQLLVETAYYTQAVMNINFMFDSTGLNNFSEASSHVFPIEDILDKRIATAKKELSEQIFVYLELVKPGESDYVNSLINNTLHRSSADYSLLVTVFLRLDV